MDLRNITAGRARLGAAREHEGNYRAERGEPGGGKERQPQAGGQCGRGGCA